ncbi:ribonuclease Z [Stutzerimonas stutzeri]|uniref:Ribonuclease Z n=1 Tax=Stutzerimonas stutzeri TaxID=316 RepID=W8REH1_STUST|nr:MBL fold metallo-hydrolase [Stutzerimonas stutzeri]AHL76897.1 ribonuclease Z [Stutzerimonas stutzeri]MCQ4331082.1 MBL fold metallo-hydrolase [Stutzerimonas stutzeri]
MTPRAWLFPLFAAGLAACAQVPKADQSAAATPDAAAKPAISVTLLGTGTPTLSADRFGYSTLIQAGGLNLVFDAGRGSSIRLSQLGVPLGKVDATFITHFHSDHLNGLADLWATSLLPTPQNRRTTPFQLYGPTGIEPIADAMYAMFAPDVDIRVKDGEISRDIAKIETHTFSHDGVVFERNGVRVTAFEVDHGEAIKPSYGFRIDHAGHSVVLSGDTRYDRRVLEAARGVDLLVHEVCIIAPESANDAWAKPILGHHTSPEEAGRLFSEAKPKLAVYSHISRPGPRNAANDDAHLQSRTEQLWSGPLKVGTDLMRIDIGDTVTVHTPDSGA